ncbi:MAG: hypothetical protein DRP71_02730 [Verrucomicrobia bacterium]|nr:MAG: hypothetical protein DRP71_02730 [Verrucomicrobiota bacterium]
MRYSNPERTSPEFIKSVKIPRNGTPLANALLIFLGMVLGMAGTWTAIRSGLLPDFFSGHGNLALESGREGGYPNGDGVPNHRTRGSSSPLQKPAWTSGSPKPINLAMALRIRDPGTRSEMLRHAGARSASRDVSGSLREGLSITRTQDRLDYYRGLVGSWSETDPEAALDHIQHDFSAGLLQTELISLAVNKWGADNPRDAWMWTEKHLSGPLREQSQADLMIGWTRRNPTLAADWLADSGIQSRLLLTTVGTTWAEQDPRSAADWAASLPSDSGRKVSSIAVAAEWARQDPAFAADYYAPEITATEGVDLATVIADIWGTTDPAATAVWVEQLPPGRVRDQAASTLATIWATRDIEAAVAWSGTITDPSTRSQVISHLGTTWGALDPDDAIAWLSTLSLEEAQVGLVGAFNSWGAVDPGGMRDWIDNTDQSDISDLGRRSLADILSQDDILTSLDLAMGIGSSTEQTDAVSRYFRHWRKIDDTSAREWFQAMEPSLSPTLRTRLQKDLAAQLVPKG